MSASVGEERRWIVLFDSIHYVLAAERVFKERGVWRDVVPVPRDLSSDCGMAIEFRESDLDAAREVLADPRVRTQAVYRPGAAGHERVDLTTETRRTAAPGGSPSGKTA